MASSSSRRMIRGALPAVAMSALAAFALVGCTNSQKDSPAGTVVTSFPTVPAAPQGEASEHGGGHEAPAEEHGAAEEHGGAEAHGASKHAELKDAAGKSVGHVTFAEDGSYLSVEAEFTGLPTGSHQFHVHEGAQCVAPDFASAGPHLGAAEGNPTQGDLPNVWVMKDGKGELQAATDAFTLEDLAARTIAIHAADGASATLACGTIK